jgi:hypothetical protein
MGRFDFSSMGLEAVNLSAAYIVEEIKRVDRNCGGKTQLGFVTADQSKRSLARLLDSEPLQILVEEFQQFDAHEQKQWVAKMKVVANRATRKKMWRDMVWMFTGKTPAGEPPDHFTVWEKNFSSSASSEKPPSS